MRRADSPSPRARSERRALLARPRGGTAGPASSCRSPSRPDDVALARAGRRPASRPALRAESRGAARPALRLGERGSAAHAREERQPVAADLEEMTARHEVGPAQLQDLDSRMARSSSRRLPSRMMPSAMANPRRSRSPRAYSPTSRPAHPAETWTGEVVVERPHADVKSRSRSALKLSMTTTAGFLLDAPMISASVSSTLCVASRSRVPR